MPTSFGGGGGGGAGKGSGTPLLARIMATGLSRRDLVIILSGNDKNLSGTQEVTMASNCSVLLRLLDSHPDHKHEDGNIITRSSLLS